MPLSVLRRFVLVVVAAVLLLAVPAAAAPNPATVSDPQGDVNSPLDIKTASAAISGSTVSLTVTTWATFTDDQTQFDWAIDTNGDGTLDFAAFAMWDGSALRAALIDFSTSQATPVTVTRADQSSIQVSFPLASIGGASDFTWAAESDFDTNGNGKVDATEHDVAPDNSTFVVPALVVRLAGADRIATSVRISQDLYQDGGADAAVLTRADRFPDALAGTPLAVAKNGPMLLTSPTALDPATEAELKRVLPAGKTVYLLGGTGALGDAVAIRVQQLGYTVVRFAGVDRYDTAIKVADQGLGNPATDFLTTGLNFPDALSAGAAAAAKDGAVLLTADTTMPASRPIPRPPATPSAAPRPMPTRRPPRWWASTATTPPGGWPRPSSPTPRWWASPAGSGSPTPWPAAPTPGSSAARCC
jgi:putative cell wall-binding protein